MAELLGRATGLCGGRSGSMNVVARDHRLLGSFGIIGGSIAAATGAGVSLRGRGAASIAFFGDGAVNQGYFLESLNLAVVLRLPVLYVCENNLYSEYTRTDLVTAVPISDRARAVGLQTHEVDGMDVRAVRALADARLTAIRDGDGPAFIEARTYRFVPHSRADPIPVQPSDEVEAWTARDPLALERSRLTIEGVASAELDAIDERTKTDVLAAIEAAFGDPFPEPDSLRTGEFV
jgi:TPP-dependent pyruvate/acetoin dehydrogenase alpha subunit